MSKARLVVTAVVLENRSQAAVARDYGVSRQWVNVLVGRYRASGAAALEPRSRRPHGSPNRISERLEDEIVELRKHLADSGLDAGADTIASHLRRRQTAPAVSTIWRALSRRGFVVPQPHKRPRSSWVRFAAEQPNERWQADITHWELAGGVEVEILDILDDHSRLAVGSEARSVFKAADVVTGFSRAADGYGLPASVLTDNGAVFTGSSRGGGWVALERELVGLGIALRHSRPYHPQTCGKVERFHQTLRPPGESGDSFPWEDLDHGTSEQVPAGVAGASGADGRRGQAGLRRIPVSRWSRDDPASLRPAPLPCSKTTTGPYRTTMSLVRPIASTPTTGTTLATVMPTTTPAERAGSPGVV